MSSAKRPRIEDLIVPTLSRAAKYKILKKVDAKDAMNYAINGDRDIVELLRQDDIWKFWFESDMDIAYTPEIPESFPREGDGPLWKRWYLWWRFAIGMFQWAIVRKQEILNAYPPNSTIRYIELNVLELTTPRETIYLDFRTEFTRIMSTIIPGVLEYTLKNINQRRNHSSSLSGIRDIKTRYKMDYNDEYHVRDLSQAISSLFYYVFGNGLVDDNIFKECPSKIYRSKRTIVASCIQCGKSAEHQCSGPCGGIVFCNAACQANDWHSAICLIGGKPGKKKMKLDGIPDSVFDIMADNEAFLETLANFIDWRQLQRYSNTSESFHRYIVRNARFWWIILRRVGFIAWDEPFPKDETRLQFYIDQGLAFINARDAPNDLLFRALQVVGRNEAAMRAMLSFWGISKKEILQLTSSNRMIRDLIYNNNFFWYIVSETEGPYDQNMNYRLIVDLPEKPIKYRLKMYWNGEQLDYYSLWDINPDDNDTIEDKVFEHINRYLFSDNGKYPINPDHVYLRGLWSDENDRRHEQIGSFWESYTNLVDMEIPTNRNFPDIFKFQLTLHVNYYPPIIEVEFNGEKIDEIPFELIDTPEKWSDLSLDVPESDHLSITYEYPYEIPILLAFQRPHVEIPFELRIPREIYNGSKPVEMVILNDLRKIDFNDFDFDEYDRNGFTFKIKISAE